jgi:hypothetical protein
MDGHVDRMRDRSGVYNVLVGNLRERDHLEDPDLDGSIILRWIFRIRDGEHWTGFIWPKIGTGGRRL